MVKDVTMHHTVHSVMANQELAAGVFDVGSKAYFTSLLQMPLTSALIVLQIVIVLIVRF